MKLSKAGAAAVSVSIFLAPEAFAGPQPVQITDKNSTHSAVVNSAGEITVDCTTGCSGGGGSGGNVTVISPLGNASDAAGVSVTLTTDAITALNNINTNVQAAIPAGSAIIGKVGIDQTTPGTTNNVTVGALTTGGLSSFHLASSAASNNATLVSTGAHTLYSLVVTGVNTAIGDVRLYDSASSPTCSSATGVVANIPVITTSGLQGGLIVPIPAQGMKFTNGLGYCITGANADNDNTNAPTGVTISLGLYD